MIILRKSNCELGISDDEQLIISNVWPLLLVKSNQYTVKGFDVSEICEILTFFLQLVIFLVIHDIIQMFVCHLFILLL